jgi:hypothetical protein
MDRLLGLTTNYTGTKDCDRPISVTDPKMAKMLAGYPIGWNALTCTSSTFPLEGGKGSIFPLNELTTEFDYSNKKSWCEDTYGVTPDFDFIFKEFGGQNYMQDFKEYSNIVFSNGGLDPWTVGCVKK